MYVRSTVNSFVPSINPIYTGYRRDKHSSYEQFAAQQDIATVALFAPDKVRQSRTGDAATAVAAARAAAKTQLQPTKAAEALFHGNISPNFTLVSRPSNEGTTHSRNGSTEDAAKVAESAEVGGEGGDAPGDGGEAEEEAMSPRELARLEGELAFAAGMAIGQIIVTAGYSGEIRIFENVGPPQWI